MSSKKLIIKNKYRNKKSLNKNKKKSKNFSKRNVSNFNKKLTLNSNIKGGYQLRNRPLIPDLQFHHPILPDAPINIYYPASEKEKYNIYIDILKNIDIEYLKEKRDTDDNFTKRFYERMNNNFTSAAQRQIVDNLHFLNMRLKIRNPFGQGPSGQNPFGQGPSGQGPSGQGPSGQGPSEQIDNEIANLVKISNLAYGQKFESQRNIDPSITSIDKFEGNELDMNNVTNNLKFLEELLRKKISNNTDTGIEEIN